MMLSIIYLILALLALSFLIFIHELGHYWMARRVGMHVETFAIGFGRPIYAWERDGVTWKIGWLLFGGYVRIRGQETSEDVDPYQIPGGFFSKSPWDRIKVAFMGPFMNLLFALVVFTILWLIGGQEKNFSEFTSKIGWVDPASELYNLGVRPGDEITYYNEQPYTSVKDHLYAPMTAGEEITIRGNQMNYANGEKVPFEHRVALYSHPAFIDKGILTGGILSPASYLIYDRLPNGKENPLLEVSPLRDSGIQYGDRIVWVDGELIFSVQQLNETLNDQRVLVTIERGGQHLLRRIPRVPVQELKLNHEYKEELTDWQFEAGLNSTKFAQLFSVPYNLTLDGTVENRMRFIDIEAEEKAFPRNQSSELEEPLQEGDRIIAVEGTLVDHSYQILQELQQRHVLIIVQRNPEVIKTGYWKDANEQFDKEIHLQALNEIAAHIGTEHPLAHVGDYYLLNPVIPKRQIDLLATNPEATHEFLIEQEKKIAAIEDPEKRAHAMQLLQKQERQYLIGLPNAQDKKVDYNPNPLQLFTNLVLEVGRTLKDLISGSLSPKWLSGPIGIVQIVHDNSMLGLGEALFWLGFVSINLGILNLLPIPVLDGGIILFALYEMITRQQIKPKTMEKLIVPFAILLIGFFFFLTYNDISRLVHNFFG